MIFFNFRSIRFSLIVLCASACVQQSGLHEMNGLWISSGYSTDAPFITMLVEDSTVRSTYLGINDYYHPVGEVDGRVVVFDPHWYPWWTLVLKGDTLYKDYSISGDTVVEKFVRGDFLMTDSLSKYQSVMFSDSPLRIRLPRLRTGGWISRQIGRRSLTTSVYIGPPKPRAGRDSIMIQVEDVLIHPSDMTDFVSREKDKLTENEQDSLKILVYADSLVEQSTLRNLVKCIREEDPNVKVYKVVMDWTTFMMFYTLID